MCHSHTQLRFPGKSIRYSNTVTKMQQHTNEQYKKQIAKQIQESTCKPNLIDL